MDRRNVIAISLVALAALGLLARQPVRAADGLVTGQVSGVFVRLADGVYRPFESGAFLPGEAPRLYAEVRFADSAQAPRAQMFVPVPQGMDLVPGDLVRALPGNLPTSRRLRIAPLPPRDRIVSLDARHDSLAARTYGQSGTLAALLGRLAPN